MVLMPAAAESKFELLMTSTHQCPVLALGTHQLFHLVNCRAGHHDGQAAAASGPGRPQQHHGNALASTVPVRGDVERAAAPRCGQSLQLADGGRGAGQLHEVHARDQRRAALPQQQALGLAALN